MVQLPLAGIMAPTMVTELAEVVKVPDVPVQVVVGAGDVCNDQVGGHRLGEVGLRQVEAIGIGEDDGEGRSHILADAGRRECLADRGRNRREGERRRARSGGGAGG